MKATIIVSVDAPEEREMADAWFSKWRNTLATMPENEGCGCCDDIWQVEGPAEAISDIPEAIREAESAS